MDEILKEIPHMENAAIIHCDLPKMPALTFDRNLGEISMEKEEFASYIKDYVKGILKYKPDAVYVEGELFSAVVCSSLNELNSNILYCLNILLCIYIQVHRTV